MLRRPCADPEKNGFKALSKEIVDRVFFTDRAVGHNLDPDPRDVADFMLDDRFFRKTVLRYPVTENAPRFVLRFENHDFAPVKRESIRARKPCGPGADDRDAPTVGRRFFERVVTFRRSRVRDETLEHSDRDRFALDPANAFPLALMRLIADASADARQRRALGKFTVCAFDVALLESGDELGDVVRIGTTFFTLRNLAVEASLRLELRFFFGVTLTYLFEVMRSDFRFLLMYRDLFHLIDRHALILRNADEQRKKVPSQSLNAVWLMISAFRSAI